MTKILPFLRVKKNSYNQPNNLYIQSLYQYIYVAYSTIYIKYFMNKISVLFFLPPPHKKDHTIRSRKAPPSLSLRIQYLPSIFVLHHKNHFFESPYKCQSQAFNGYKNDFLAAQNSSLTNHYKIKTLKSCCQIIGLYSFFYGFVSLRLRCFCTEVF